MEIALPLIDYVSKLVAQILKARNELRNAPQKVLELVKEVENTEGQLEQVRGLSDKEPLDKILGELGRELERARQKVEQCKRAKKRNCLVETAKAVFRQGAAKQNKETESISRGIQKLLVDLHQALQLLNTRKIDAIVGLRPAAAAAAASLPVLIGHLDRRALACLDQEELTVQVRIANSHTYDFQPPPIETQGAAITAGGDGDGDGRSRRAAKEGGYEIANSTKVKFIIENVMENGFFYVLVYDETEGTPTTLFFPQYVSSPHNLVRNVTREFPNHIKFKHDPIHLVIEKSKNLGIDGIGRQKIYIILSCRKLHPDEVEFIKLEHIEGIIDDGVVVRKFIFDIK